MMENQKLIDSINNKYVNLGEDIIKLINENEKLKVRIVELESELELSQEEKLDIVTALVDEEINLLGIKHPQYEAIIDKLYEELCIEKPSCSDSRAVLLVAKDVSGSMGVWESYLSRCVTNWTRGVLDKQYSGNIEVRYITYTTVAEEVEEDAFNKKSESGGTIVSSGLRKINEITESYRYEDKDDVYILLLSDGDNLTSDIPRCKMLLNRLSNKASKIWYTEMNSYSRYSSLANMVKDNVGDLEIEFNVIKDKKDVYETMQNMFGW